MRTTQKDLQDILNQIAEKANLATNSEDAQKMGLDKYLYLEYASIYGGYRLVNVNLKNGGHSGAFGESACEKRLPAKAMAIKLKGILSGINLNK